MRFKSFYLIVCCLLLVEAVQAEDGPQSWLDKMGRSLREQTYKGIYTYMRGKQFDTVQITHRFSEGQEYERLYHLNGEARVIERRGHEVVCNHLTADQIDLDHEVPVGPFTRKFHRKLTTYKGLYEISLRGRDRIAGRSAVKLVINPIRNDRYGYRLWLDEKTGLLLQSHLVDRGRVLEVFQFAQLSTGELTADENIAEMDVASRASNEAMKHVLSTEPQKDSKQAKPNWKASWLPRGFRLVATPRDGNRLVFSDGMATLSVFVDGSGRMASPELTTHKGGTVVFSRRKQTPVGTQQVTIVGEVPLETARRVAESIEPVIY